MKALINKLLKRQSPQFGAKIFYQESWLDKKVNDALFNRKFFLD